MTPIPELDARELRDFTRQVLRLHRPLVLRGLAALWPAVHAAGEGLEPALRFWLAQANDEPVDALLGHPADGRQFGFAPGLEGFNFLRDSKPIAAVLEALWRYARFPDPPALALQSADVRRCMPGFEASHPMPWLDAAPRVWLGNRATVPAHFDSSYNLAVVVAGRRRFDLFAPEQIGNLYFGPLEHAPTQAPVSLVDVQAPDLTRFPRAAQALAAGLSAELAPGDALFMPPLWVHSVVSLEAFNGLVNYWWRPETAPGAGADSPSAALWLAALTFRNLPEAERRDWQRLFALLAFDLPDDPAQGDWAHLPAERRGLLGTPGAAEVQALRQRIKTQIPD